jgi:putative ABC transport system ATP-binding protein
MATIAEPSLLLLDEHTAALDPKVAATIMALTEAIVVERGLTTLMVTHNMDLALRYGDRLIMMHAGRIVLDIDRAQRDAHGGGLAASSTASPARCSLSTVSAD